jgi:hypothetical protein
MSHDPKQTMDALAQTYRLKDGSVGPPTQYLRANVLPYELPDGRVCWGMSSKDYVMAEVKNVENNLADECLELKKKGTDRPFPIAYRPQIDVSPELSAYKANLYQQWIGVLR